MQVDLWAGGLLPPVEIRLFKDCHEAPSVRSQLGIFRAHPSFQIILHARLPLQRDRHDQGSAEPGYPVMAGRALCGTMLEPAAGDFCGYRATVWLPHPRGEPARERTGLQLRFERQ